MLIELTLNFFTAKVAGTEVGITEPVCAFSPCFSAPFLVFHPNKYADMLIEKVKKHNVNCWLVNTGWSGGGYGVGSRMKLSWTRAIIDAIHSGELANAEYEQFGVFNLSIPKSVTNVPSEILNPVNTWKDKAAYKATLEKLAQKFVANFSSYADGCTPETVAAGPKL